MTFHIYSDPDVPLVAGAGTFDISLDDSELPEQGVEIGGSTRMVETRYPGSSDVSVQILGNNDADVTIKGTLNDVWTGTSGSARERALLFERLRRSQQQVVIQWGSLIHASAIVRDVKLSIQFESLINYEMTFLITRTHTLNARLEGEVYITGDSTDGITRSSSTTTQFSAPTDADLVREMVEAERRATVLRFLLKTAQRKILENIDINQIADIAYQQDVTNAEVFGV